VTIVPIDCYDIIPAAGAIHCIVMQVPRYTDAAPSVHVLSPDGGEVFTYNRTHAITWSASDDVGVTSVDLSYSLDGGLTFPHTIATDLPDTGHYAWKVPPYLGSDAARVRVVVHDGSSNSAEAISASDFVIEQAVRAVHDFSSGAGVDKWAFGYQTSSWTQVNGQRRPAAIATPFGATSLARIATSNAIGGDGDTARYISPIPSSNFESSHIFEFRVGEPLESLLDLEVVWEGYGDDCVQVELYVWDDVALNWGDARGNVGANRYAANWAGNVDETLSVHIQEDIGRYVTANGLLTVLVYAERSIQESFCDYVALRTTSLHSRHHTPSVPFPASASSVKRAVSESAARGRP
jgi:hypothetical protein